MRLTRTSFAYEAVVQHLALAGRNPLIEIYLVQFLLVAFYAEVEEHLKRIVQNRLSEVQDKKVASFIFKMSEGMIRRVKKAEINDLLQKFDCGEGDIIARLIGEVNLQPYFDVITNRHLVSHDDGAQMTLEYFGTALPCAELVLDTVEQALAGPA